MQVLTGPRQVGKTTLLIGLIDQVPDAVYRAVDAPEAAMSGWWENLWSDVDRRARSGKVTVFLDEIHYLDGWERLVKAKVDELRRKRTPVHLALTGSSSLLVGRGLKETMAGRFESLKLNHWGAADLMEVFDLTEESAVEYLVSRGSYPGAFPLREDAFRWQCYMRESILEPAIGRDILMLEPVRKPALLRQLLMLCLAHPAKIIALHKLAGIMRDKGALETLSHYLHVLEQAFLVAGIKKFSGRALRRRSSPPKIVVLNNGLIAALREMDAGGVKRGAWVENACLAHAYNSGQEVFYWREEPLEVDGVFTGSWGKWAVEIKTGRFAARDLRGLLEFCRRYPDFQPLVLCSRRYASETISGVRMMYWGDFLMGAGPDESAESKRKTGSRTRAPRRKKR
ncbi:MAG: AAA family ATPase [Elusimicrobiota bacterium]